MATKDAEHLNSKMRMTTALKIFVPAVRGMNACRPARYSWMIDITNQELQEARYLDINLFINLRGVIFGAIHDFNCNYFGRYDRSLT